MKNTSFALYLNHPHVPLQNESSLPAIRCCLAWLKQRWPAGRQHLLLPTISPAPASYFSCPLYCLWALEGALFSLGRYIFRQDTGSNLSCCARWSACWARSDTLNTACGLASIGPQTYLPEKWGLARHPCLSSPKGKRRMIQRPYRFAWRVRSCVLESYTSSVSLECISKTAILIRSNQM